MKFFLSQFNPTLGAIAANKRRISEVIAAQVNADILVFPELALSGYPPQDLLFSEAFMQANEQALLELAATVGEPLVIVGCLARSQSRNPQDRPKRYNSAAIMQDGRIVAVVHKTLLPTYDVFDEWRYFTPADENIPLDITVRGRRIRLGIEICEDLWDDTYREKVTANLARAGAEVIVNISASPFVREKREERRRLLQERALENKVTLLYCNMAGAQDELIYDGDCLAANQDGEIIAAAPAFAEAGLHLDIDAQNRLIVGTYGADLADLELIYQALLLGIRDYVHKSGFFSVVLGLSGGIDSALVAALATAALGAENVHCLLMPSAFSTPHSLSDARTCAEKLGCPATVLAIEDSFQTLLQALQPLFADTPFGLAEENIQARLRGLLVMAISNKHGHLALATGNKSEFTVGYSTLYGDMCGALAPIGDLQKSEVYALAKYINERAGSELIPSSIIDKRPSAELRPEQYDPFDYSTLSPLAEALVENRQTSTQLSEAGFDRQLIAGTQSALYRSEFKRFQAPPILKISATAFGTGRRMPLVNHFREANDAPTD
jgi:NAD+ synthase (glutamine-hydrolysing)